MDRQNLSARFAIIVIFVFCASANGQHENVTQVRLVGGGNNATGRLEIYYKGHWSTVYDSYLKLEDAKVACKMLGFQSGVGTMFPTNYDLFGHATTSYQIRSQFRCVGDETNLNLCPGGLRTLSVYNSQTPARGHNAEISCEGTNIRLVDGDSSMSGRVELSLNNQWYTVCDYQFDDKDAHVLCRMLGYGTSNVSKSFAHGHFGQGHGVQILSGLQCDGTETDIKQCPATWGTSHSSSCDHRADAGITCGSTQIRLADGPTKNSGRVEVLHAGKWGTVCSSGSTFTRQDVMVICRSLGFNNPNAFGFATSVYGEGTGHVAVYGLNCDGSEVDIVNCRSSGWTAPYASASSSYCTHQKDIGVNCDGKTPIRLANGDSEQSGRVEIQTTHGHWGTVSDIYFDKHDLRVICRMLGYEYNENSFFVKNAFYGEGVGHVLVSRLQCDGDEADIGQCDGTWTSPSTVHTRDVGVSCDGAMTVRLVGGSNNASGRVEFLRGGYYRSLCSYGFERTELIVVCRMLGYDNIPQTASWRLNADYNLGLGVIGASSLTCDGTESSIGQCGGTFPASTSCTHQKDVYVNCNGEPEEMRLVGGPNKYSGRVEVNVSGRWGTVCSYGGFTREDAVVICRILKFQNPEQAVAYSSASHFGQGNGTIAMSSIKCTGIETNLDMCGVQMDHIRYCTHSYDAGVDCCPSGNCDSGNTGFIVG